MQGRKGRYGLAAIALTACAAVVPAATVLASSGGDSGNDRRGPHALGHVLLISIDGLHQSDVSW